MDPSSFMSGAREMLARDGDASDSNQMDVPAEWLDYDFIRTCSDSKKLKAILSLLRSGREGKYPDLEAFAEKTLVASFSERERSLYLAAEGPTFPEIEAARADVRAWLSSGRGVGAGGGTEPAASHSTASRAVPPVRGSSSGVGGGAVVAAPSSSRLTVVEEGKESVSGLLRADGGAGGSSSSEDGNGSRASSRVDSNSGGSDSKAAMRGNSGSASSSSSGGGSNKGSAMGSGGGGNAHANSSSSSSSTTRSIPIIEEEQEEVWDDDAITRAIQKVETASSGGVAVGERKKGDDKERGAPQKVLPPSSASLSDPVPRPFASDSFNSSSTSSSNASGSSSSASSSSKFPVAPTFSIALASSQRFKNMGNESFKAAEFVDAVSQYSKAIDCFGPFLEPPPAFSGEDSSPPRLKPEDAAEMKGLLAILYANRCMACIKIDKHHAAGADAEAAVAADPSYSKAWMRRAQARMHGGRFTEAALDFEMAVKLEEGKGGSSGGGGGGGSGGASSSLVSECKAAAALARKKASDTGEEVRWKKSSTSTTGHIASTVETGSSVTDAKIAASHPSNASTAAGSPSSAKKRSLQIVEIEEGGDADIESSAAATGHSDAMTGDSRSSSSAVKAESTVGSHSPHSLSVGSVAASSATLADRPCSLPGGRRVVVVEEEDSDEEEKEGSDEETKDEHDGASDDDDDDDDDSEDDDADAVRDEMLKSVPRLTTEAIQDLLKTVANEKEKGSNFFARGLYVEAASSFSQSIEALQSVQHSEAGKLAAVTRGGEAGGGGPPSPPSTSGGVSGEERCLLIATLYCNRSLSHLKYAKDLIKEAATTAAGVDDDDDDGDGKNAEGSNGDASCVAPSDARMAAKVAASDATNCLELLGLSTPGEVSLLARAFEIGEPEATTTLAASSAVSGAALLERRYPHLSPDSTCLHLYGASPMEPELQAGGSGSSGKAQLQKNTHTTAAAMSRSAAASPAISSKLSRAVHNRFNCTSLAASLRDRLLDGAVGNKQKCALAVKALVRRAGAASDILGLADEAQRDISAALYLEPANEQVRGELRKVRAFAAAAAAAASRPAASSGGRGGLKTGGGGGPSPSSRSQQSATTPSSSNSAGNSSASNNSSSRAGSDSTSASNSASKGIYSGAALNSASNTSSNSSSGGAPSTSSNSASSSNSSSASKSIASSSSKDLGSSSEKPSFSSAQLPSSLGLSARLPVAKPPVVAEGGVSSSLSGKPPILAASTLPRSPASAQAAQLAAASIASSALKASVAKSPTAPPATGALLEHELHRRSGLPLDDTVSFLIASFPTESELEERLPSLFKRTFDPDVVSIFLKVAAARAQVPLQGGALPWSVALLGGMSRVTGWSSCALMLTGKEKESVRQIIATARDTNAVPADKLATVSAAFRL